MLYYRWENWPQNWPLSRRIGFVFERTEECFTIGESIGLKTSHSPAPCNSLQSQKAQRGGAIQSIFLENLTDEQLDPGKRLSQYCEMTEKYRTNAWIKKELKAAGVDTECFFSHSTRGAAATRAMASGVLVESILRAGHW
uniref:Tyr recombinase domain-containing protein n=1 Tax=Daphnia galeata TaxID=27404 RepID=A0A8J2RN93_9CRUS|nr:unnamed protein product [Daphnia galeata]